MIEYYQRFKTNDVRFNRVVSHGNAVGIYFYDPEDNILEVYWTSPFKALQPFVIAIDVNRPIDEIMKELEASVKIHGATGHIDRESFEKQREQFRREGIRY